MRLYVVLGHIANEGDMLNGIFSTREKAEECLKIKEVYYENSEVSADIEEWELDKCHMEEWEHPS